MSGTEIVGLVSVIQTVLHGYRAVCGFIRGIREMGHDVADLEGRSREAETRLYAFAKVHNLVIAEGRTAGSVMPPYWVEAVTGRMGHIKGYLDEAQEIFHKYSAPPNVTDASSTSQDLAQDPDSGRFDLQRRPTDSQMVTLGRSEFAARRKIIQNLSLRKKITWSMKDRDTLRETVAKLERENDGLFYLTVPQLGTLIYDAVASRLSGQLHRVDGGGTSQSSAPGIRERAHQLSVARELVQKLEQESKPEKLRRKLELSLLPDIMTNDSLEHPTRHTTILEPNGGRVLVEWKEYNPEKITREEVVLRFSNVSAILNAPPAFMENILASPGFVEDERSNDRGTCWIGLVYFQPAAEQSGQLRTLRSLMSRPAGERRGSEQWKPPLGDCFKLAAILAQSLLSVHNCNWYHKGLRPENVVFFSSAKSIRQPYLLGWDYARPAAVGEKTETVITPDGDGELYQSPDWFEATSGQQQSRFRIEYDQYQLGCLLLEIGYWKTLSDMKKLSSRSFEGDGWHQAWRDYLVNKARKLVPVMGAIYSEVTVNLLQGLNNEGQELEFWDTVVLRLRECNA